jgi:hypothetical protein
MRTLSLNPSCRTSKRVRVLGVRARVLEGGQRTEPCEAPSKSSAPLGSWASVIAMIVGV